MTVQQGYPKVQGRCVACHLHSLFLGKDGYVTCSSLQCPDPLATTRLLEEAHTYLPPGRVTA